MKGFVIFVSLMLLVTAAGGVSRSIIDPEDLGIKAGPTEPAEEIAMVWLEAFVYPKLVKDDRMVSLGTRLTSKVRAVEVTFDFGKDIVSLSSHDGMNWSGAYEIPAGVAKGVHIVRYHILGSKGSLRRTVEFFVDEAVDLAKKEGGVACGEAVSAGGWPLTVTSTCAALVGGSSRILYVGQKVVGLSKVPWYKVIFEDGEEGWIPASRVKEPLDEYYQLGYKAYQKKDYLSAIKHYKNAIAIDPEFVKGYFWLAKSYCGKGDFESAYRAVRKAMRLDERNIECKIFANSLAQRYFKVAHAKFRDKRYHEAIAAYRNILELKPNSTISWIELGKSYQNLGFAGEAKSAWQEGLRQEPENEELRALLGKEPAVAVLDSDTDWEEPKPKPVEAEASPEIPPVLADDSLQIVKDGETRKGTRIAAALKSVISMTKSLGTQVVERGWEIKKEKDKYLVRYLCEQGRGVMEAFEWLVDVDTKRISAHNSNAKLLMERW